MIRLFVAFPCPPELEDALIHAQYGIEGMRWVPPENLHCTVRFVGEVELPVAEDIAAALQGLSATAPTVHLFGVGVFDHGRSGAVWARVAPKEALEALHRKIDRAIVGCGLKPEGRAYIPHVTLGRWSRGAVESTRWADRWAGLESAPVRIPELRLYESILASAGPTYHPLLTLRLRA